MGLREIRRMRGEMGRAMFMNDLEADAFAGVEGYDVEYKTNHELIVEKHTTNLRSGFHIWPHEHDGNRTSLGRLPLDR